MEIYSIIQDLYEIPCHKSLLTLTREALIRNRQLLKKYSRQFKNSNTTQFIRKVRRVSKQNRLTADSNRFLNQRMSCPLISYQQEKDKESVAHLSLKFKTNLQRKKCIWESVQRLSILKSKQNNKKMIRTPKEVKKIRKKLLEEYQNGKITIISLGQNFQQYDQKIRSYLRYRYKSKTGRVKNWYYSPKSPVKSLDVDSCLVKYSLAGYISRNLSKY